MIARFAPAGDLADGRGVGGVGQNGQQAPFFEHVGFDSLEPRGSRLDVKEIIQSTNHAIVEDSSISVVGIERVGDQSRPHDAENRGTDLRASFEHFVPEHAGLAESFLLAKPATSQGIATISPPLLLGHSSLPSTMKEPIMLSAHATQLQRTPDGPE